MTVSQVCAFWPPPCRNTTCGGSSPHFNALMSPESMRATVGSGPVCADLFGVLGQQRELVEVQQVVVGDLRHGSTLRTAEIQVRSERSLCQRRLHGPHAVRTDRIDDPHRRGRGLAGHGAARGDVFRRHWRPQEASDMWRTMMPAGGAVVACDGPTSSGWRVPGSETDRAGRRRAADGRACPGWRWRRRIGGAACFGRCSPNCTAGWATIRSPGWRPARPESTAGSATGLRRSSIG